MYQALITDLDGTAVAITSNGEDVDQTTKQSVQTALEQGKKLTCATGRSWKIAKPVVQALGFTAPCIIEGGTRIIDPITEKTLWEKTLADHTGQEILKIFKSESDQGTVMHSEDQGEWQPLNNEVNVPKNVRFIYLLGITQEAATRIIHRISSRHDAVAHPTPSWDGNNLVDVHVTHPEATKQHAIQVWQKLESIDQAETIGMGDGGNDLPIFLSAGLKVAVEDGTPSLKAQADYIAPTATNHALKHVIDTFLIE